MDETNPLVSTPLAPLAACWDAPPSGERLQELGNELYPLVAADSRTVDAGKVTGMLLQLPESQVVAAINDSSRLSSLVVQAMDTLRGEALRELAERVNVHSKVRPLAPAAAPAARPPRPGRCALTQQPRPAGYAGGRVLASFV